MNLFFKPPLVETRSRNILCIPFLWTQKRKWLGSPRSGPLGCHCHDLEQAILVTGFMGAPHLLALLAFLLKPETRVWFLGTAGSLQAEADEPVLWAVRKTARSGTELFAEWTHAQRGISWPAPGRNLVSVTTLQEENPLWFNRMVSWQTDGVDMETAFLNHSLHGRLRALVAVSDRITPNGIEVFDRRKLSRVLEEGWSLCMQDIKEQS